MPTASRIAILAVFAVACFGAAMPVRAQSMNVDLLSNYDPRPGWHSDIWGYTSPEGVELAIMGCRNGTSFINVTDPEHPVEVAYITGANSTWRDIKTYGHYAYIVCDQGNDGLKIVDLANPLAPSLVNTITTHWSTAHNVWIDPQRGLLMAAGANTFNNVIILDLVANPVNPPLVYRNGSFYSHDYYSRDNIGYAAAIYDGTLKTLNMAPLPASMPVLDEIATDNVFTHNVWLTDDGDYALTTDEQPTGHVTIVDVSDPSNLVKVGSYINPRLPNVIIHNVTVKENLAYASWYTAGLEIFDVTNPRDPVQVGFYDTYPGNQAEFDGAWGVYPYAESGNIYVSDISTGLWVFRTVLGRIEGGVTDADSGEPIEGVTVRASSNPISSAIDIETTSDGIYGLSLAPGEYTLQVTKFGYTTSGAQVEVTRDGIEVTNFELQRLPTGSLSGTVTNAAGGTGLGGARVELLDTPLSATTAANGSFSFPSVPAGSYLIKASLFGFGAAEGVANIQGGVPTNVNLSLSASPILVTMESNPNWTVGAAGDNATSGIWTRVEPVGTYDGQLPVQPETDHTVDPGQLCWVTGQGTDPFSIGQADVDNGRTTLVTSAYDLTGLGEPTVRYFRWYVNEGGPSVDDVFRVDVSSNNGTTWVNLETLGETRREWEQVEFYLPDYITITNQAKLRFIADDSGGGSIVEAGIDDFEVFAIRVSSDAPDVITDPIATRLFPASPNPVLASSGATLRFQIPTEGPVSLEIVDVAGRRVSELIHANLPAGEHAVEWNGRDDSGRPVPGGIYFQKLTTAGSAQTGKITVLR